MASRRQRLFDRKYSSYRKYTATEDVSYAAHTSRSSYRSESMTQRSGDRGRSSSSEIVTGSETRSLPVYIAIQDYTPEPGDTESVALEQGQIVEVLDKKNAASWLIRTKARPPKSGWVPGSYFETPTEYYKQRRRTREITGGDLNLTEEQEAIMKRDQVYHDLLHSEEEYVAELRHVVEDYVKAFDDPSVPKEVAAVKDQLALNLKELCNFHANVMLKGLQYYSDDPGKVGQTFIRLERDFDHHVQLHHKLPAVLELLSQPTIKQFFQELSDKIEAGAKTYEDYLKTAADRMVQYQNYFKEFVKYSSRAKLSTKSMQKALELTLSVPQRAKDMEFINNIEQYPGDTNRLGRLYRHDRFIVWEGEQESQERYLFLFKNKLMITERNDKVEPITYKHLATIRLDKYTVKQLEGEDNTLELKPNEPGLPGFRIRAKDAPSVEFVRQAWLKDIQEMKESLASEQDAETETTTEFDMNMSDIRSEFSEYSTVSHKSSYFNGPEEGPPRKKIKSPPAISPTGSSTSLYSGGSSSIDWTTTGTTLDMQGTRVTRTQYGFRTLQESSAKMCLKVTGYPLPDITWYKDDELLHEDERHTFYSDEDGFFALTIDPVRVEDTGRYTCMATNEYGQASTSAFFRVLKVEKEAAPPAFVNSLKDQEVKEGEVACFECEVEGWPEPELLWLVDDQPLRPSHDFRLEYDGQNAKLEIRDAQPEDTGVYTVRIKNEYGSAESNAKLVVQPDPDKNHVAPEFQATIEDVECDEGDTVRFKAVITGDPNPEVTWLVNGIPLSESDKIKFISEDGICIVTIQDVSRHFDGIITCQAVNRLGSQSCDGRLKVRVPPAPPQFVRSLEDKIVQEGSTFMLEAELSGFPEPAVSFSIGGKAVVSGVNGIQIIEKGNGVYRIEISSASVENHDGEVVCTASNEHGQAESRARIVVEPVEEESRSAPTFIKDIEDQTVKYGENAIFETSVKGNPKPEVIWFLNGQKLDKFAQGVTVETLSVNDYRLTLDSTQYAGTVLCRAENAVGRFETKAKLTVLTAEKKHKAPEFIESLSDKSAVQESTAVFEVRVDAEPKETLKWILNDEELHESTEVHIREFDGSCKLELHNVTLEQGGTLRCVAENSEGRAECSARLEVTRKPFAPHFDKRPANVTVQRGAEARFEAHADSVPQPIYQWSVGGRKVRDSTEGARVELVDGVSVLIVETEKFDSLTVTVTAENSLGIDETGARLTIEERAMISEEKMEEGKTRVIEEKIIEEGGTIETITTKTTERIGEGGKIITETLTETHISETAKEAQLPVIKKPLMDQRVKPGEMAHFETIIAPAETVQWFSNGRLLDETLPGVTISQDEHFEFRLTVDSAQYAGVISVRAQNAAGMVEMSAKLVAAETTADVPQILAGLTDISVTEGDRLKISVTASNATKIEWSLNGKIVHDGEAGVKIVEKENASTLEVTEVKKEHSGEIRVTVTNEAGEVSTTSKLTVADRAVGPEILRGPDSIFVKEGENAEFKCDITGKPEPTVEWKLNDKIIEYGTHENITVKAENGRHTLVFEKATLEQAGEICVTAENAGGIFARSCVLKVEPDVSKPVFKTHLIDRHVEEGEPLRWDVSIERSTTETKVAWFLNGEQLISNENVQIVDHGDGSYHLTVSEAKTSMNGTLVVTAENVHGKSESRAFVEVKEQNKKPEFTKNPQDHETVEETSVKFSAIVTGKPTPAVTWLLNDVEIVSSEEIRVKYEESTGKTSIRIMKPNESQSGKVTVCAENSMGRSEVSAKLTVEKKKEPPRFLADMDSRQVNEGDTVKFAVTVAGTPSPEVQWFLNGEPITASSTVTITAENETHTLTMTEVVPEQSGEISCEARNSVGFKKQNAMLAVKMVGEAPTFSKNIEDRLVVEGEELIMEAKLAQVKPKPTVSWLRNGKPLTDSRFVVNAEEDGTLTLRITSTEMDDKSRITIRAENAFGTAECSASIGIQKKRPMAKPAFLSEIAPITVTEGESLETKLIITGDPTPFAKWYINDQLVCATEDTEMKSESGVYSLTIHGATKDMTGTIKCTAYNRMGEVTTQGKVTVIAPIPVEFETTLCDATCREGDTLKLKAVLLGEPTPVVTWYVNDKKLEETQNIKIHAEKGTYTVTIKDITCDYSGKVVCEAVNEFGKASSEAMLLVLPRGEPPDFLEWLSNVKARPGSQVTHKVVFTGDPRPVLTWFINNEEVKESEEISIVTTHNTSTLVIKSFVPEKHIGEIICKAENEAGEVSCTASMGMYTSDMFSESESEAMAEEVLDFEDATEQGTEDESLADEVHRTPTPVMAPKFITKIKDTRAARGHQAIFECVVPDTKGVCCKWLKDGKEIELIARIRVQTRTVEGYTTSELIIDDVELEDAGKYTVVVENAAGSDACEATLNVIEKLTKEVKTEPEFIISLQSKTVKAAEKIVFECKVNGEPHPTVTWFHEKVPVVEEAKRTIIESDGSVQRLVITAADFDDAGKYVCVAENAAGKAHTEAVLTVQAQAPQFTHNITDKEISIGEKLVLECAVKGAPQPTVQFFADKTRLISNEHVSIEHDHSNVHWRMVIEETKEEDFKKYHAVATNAAGVAECQAEVKQKEVKVRPKIEQGLKARTINESEEMCMEVKVSGQPEPEVKWFKDGKPIEEIDMKTTIKKEPNGIHVLTVKNARLEDAGEYAVEVVNTAGKEISAANVAVLETPEAPHFVESLVDQKVNIGETVEMKVVTSGKPEPQVQWFKDDYPVNIDNERVISKKEENGQYTLIIKEAQLQDVGVYSCKASNRGGFDETKANFSVQQEEGAPVFTERLGEVSVTESETAQFSVTVKGEPLPEVQWFKDGAPVNVDNEHIIVKKDESGNHSLIVKKACLEDAGIYSCKATNAKGSDETTAKFAVESELQVPKFVEGLKELTVDESETAELSVVVAGKPEPAVEWLRNGIPVQIDNVHTISKKDEKGHHTLVIKEARLEDIGTYSCKATNKAGTVETKANFAVQESVEAPIFTEGLSEVTVQEFETANLSVTVVGKPEPEVQWFKDGAPVNIDNVHVISKKEENGQHTLTIKQARLEDSGTYSCKAVNKAGTTETKANFAVQESVEAPIFTEGLSEVAVQEFETANLSVTVVGKPEPEVQWFKDGAPVNIDNVHVISKKEENGQHTLTIKQARLEDSGTYSCKAVNKAGTIETKAMFAVEEELMAPTFEEELHEFEVSQGDKVEISCTVVGKPEPEVKWTKNGVEVHIDNSHIIKKSDEHGKHTLVIADVNKKDIGTYSCVASNKAGEAKTTGELKFPKYGFEKMQEEEVKPMFIEPLQTHSVKEGETTSFECRVNVESNAEITWLRDGKPLGESANLVIEELEKGLLKLTVLNATTEDVGTYSCEAVNKSGKAATEAKLNLSYATTREEHVEDESALIGFVKPISDVVVEEGAAAKLECALEATLKDVKVEWSKDGKSVPSDVVIDSLPDGTQTLTINEASAEHVGAYRCTASVADASAYTEGKISVSGTALATVESAAEGPPEFVELLKSCTTTVKSEAVLRCKVKGSPRPTISWTKEGIEIKESENVVIEYHDDGTVILRIKEASLNESGEYRCDASNEFGAAWTEAPINVAAETAVPQEGEAPDFLEPIRPVTVLQGDTAVLEGKVSGEPKPEVKWYKGDTLLQSGNNIAIESLPDGTQRLIVKNATQNDTDEYRCSASNEYGDVWSDVTLTVQVPTTMEEEPMELSAPTFLKTLEETSANESDYVALECVIIGKPMPEIKWYKDKEEIQADDAHFKKETLPDGTARLIISSAVKADAGEYRCEARNSSGTARTEALLTVLYAFEEPLESEICPEFLQELKPVQANEGQLAVFECRVSGVPRPEIKWFKDGEEIKPDEHTKIESLPDGTNRLIVDSAKVDDQGNYRCEATNTAGSMSSKAPMTVNAPETLKVKKELEDVNVVEGVKIRLYVEVEGQPKTVKWFKGKEEILSNRRTVLEKISEQEYKLEIEQSQLSDAGSYRVVLSTETESVESSSTVTVTKKVAGLTFKKGLEDKTVPKGSSLSLEIEVEGKPKDVKWYKAGSPVDKIGVKTEDLGGGKYRLLIPEVKAEDAGNYSVQITNEAGSVESNASVTVQPVEEKPEFINGLHPTTVKVGDKVVLEVETKGNVKQVKWYKNGKDATDAETNKVSDGKFQLIIRSASLEDAGDYKVVISNDSGSAGSSAKLSVQTVAPALEIVSGLKDVSTAEGERVQLEIQTSVKPEKATWYKDGEELKPSESIKIEIVNETTCRLTIPSAKTDDTAEFKVVVSAKDDSAFSACSLVVKAPMITITKGLEDQTVTPGQKVILEVEASHPPKQVRWYKNGKEIAPSDKAKPKTVGDRKFQLEIPDATKDDAAQYKVAVSNDAGTADSACALTVQLPKLTITKPLADQTVSDGDVATLTIEVNAPPKVIKWYKNGKEILPTDKGKPKKISDTKYALEIADAGKDDTAEYKVSIADEDSTAESSCALTVRLPKLIITKGLEDQTANVGEKVHLGVEVNSKPRTIKWYKNGKEVAPNDKEKPVKVSDTNYQLEIPDVTLDDKADYKVVLANEDSTAESSCTLVVKLPAEKPAFKKGIEDQTIPVGKPFEIVIETTGSPKTVKWYKNGQAISAEKNKLVKIKKVDDNNYTLTVEKSTVEDSGTYSVEIENEAGKAKSSGEVTVEPELVFLTPLKDVDVVEGEEAEFSVETNCRPRLVKWYKNGTELKPVSGRIDIKDNTTKFRLIIAKTEKSDAATYKVVVSNSAGEVDSSAKLSVKKAKGQPRITKGLDDQVIAKGSELILEIKVDGEPTEVRWFKDDLPITKSANVKVEKIDEQTYRLTIPKADTTDAGSYKAEVSNEVGKVHTSGIVEVDEKPEIVKGLEDGEIDEGEEHSFRVETNVPVRTVKWYKNGQEIKATPKITMKMINPKKYELFIAKTSLDDTATYKVTLGNAAGECDSSASLTVKKLDILRLLKGLTDLDVAEGEPIELTAKVEGQPRQVKWYKNGQEISPDARIQLIENRDSGEYTLKITDSVPSDGAAYRIVLSNEKGEVQSSAITHVKAKKVEPVASAAMFVTPLEDVDVPEGDTLTLKCKVAGEPTPTIRWEKDGAELQKSDRIVMRAALDGTLTLRVLDAKKSDAGKYRVIATNSAGESSSECTVGVTPSEELPSAPKFIIPLQATSTQIGTKAEFSVKVRGFPKPTLRWFINDKEVTKADDVTIEDMGDGRWTMTVTETKAEHAGTIRCTAENENGKDECEARLTLTEARPRGREEEGYPPRFNVPLWDRRIPVGQLMSVECHVDAKPLAEIRWTKDGVTLENTDRLTVHNTTDGACRLRIVAFSRTDVGVYKCTATNSYGVADTRANLNVLLEEIEEEERRREYAPRFNPPLTDKFVNDGDKVILSCRVDAVPRAGVIWYKDGLSIKNDGRTLIETDDEGNCLLTIFSANESDDGAYRCVATNEHGSTNTACMVNVKKVKEEVKKGGEEPFFTKGLVDKWLDRGDTLELSCTVTGDPKPDIKWYRNGMLMRSTGRITLEKFDDGRCTLTITDCTMSDEGIYRCEAENAFGKAKTQSTVHVQMAVGRSDKKKIYEGQAPRFIIPLEDLTVFIGSSIELECKVAGDPTPQVKWSKDGAPIWDDPRYLWEADTSTGVYKLKIENVMLDDEGTYRCVATNDAGSATTKAFLRIDDGTFADRGPSVMPPRFTISLGDARAVEGQPLRMECKVEGVPLPELVWYKDGEKITPSERVRMELDGDGSARIIISPCRVDDEGIYRVIATSSSGSAHDKGTAYVKKLPAGVDKTGAQRKPFDAYRAPKVIIPLESVKVPETGRLVLSCRFSGDPRPSIKWFKDGERVYAYGNCQLIERDDGTCELILESAGRFDGGGYRCVAENEYGSARTTCEVTVQLKEKKPIRIEDELKEGKAPGFSVPLMMKRVKQGEAAVLECVPYGKPFPAIKWLKDGIEISEDSNLKIGSAEDGTQRITIKQAEFCSEGYYRCVATNEYGTASTKGELVVEGDRTIRARKVEDLSAEPVESKPRIRRGLYNMSIYQGSVIEMQVCTTGWPTPTVKWFKNGQEIKSEDPDGRRVIWTDERGIHRCVILNSLPEDEGEYALEATNKLGVARTEGVITIILPREVQMYGDETDRTGTPYPPGFIRQLKNKHVFSHMPTIFDCLVVGHPPPEVDWYHNGKKIVPGGRVRIQASGGGSHAIIIMDTLPEDAGEYVAIARNAHGTASSSAVLDVTVPHLDEIKFNGSIDVTPYLTEEYGFKKLNYASFPTPPDHGPFIKEVTGHYLTLSWIPTKRSPPRYPQVTYVIEIRELPEKEWTLLDYNIPEPVCKVRNLELGKSYQFRVRAENIYGISDPSPASPPSRLMAPPQPVLDKNKRVIPLLDPYAERALDQAYAEQYACAPWFAPGVVEKRYCAANDTLTLTLHVSGYPDPKIVWKFRGWDVDTTGPLSKTRVATYGGTETTLTVSGFSKDNVGQYQCVATNQYGEAQQNIFVDLATRPSFLQPLMNKIVSSSKTLRLDVRVEGSPFPELKWMKEWRPIVESSRTHFVQDGPYLCSLIITDPMWRDSGIYSVTAVNEAGTATTSCTVTVEAEGNFDDVQSLKKKVALETRKVRELYEIDENDEKAAAAGAPFHVTERESGRRFMAQLRPLDESLARNIQIHNSLDHPNIVQFHQVVMDQGIAVLVYENVGRTLLDSLVAGPSSTQQCTEHQVQVFVKQLLTALKFMHDKKIAHLDLRPEAILLQDDHLRLADFGQSRRLVRGKVAANIMGSPEFVSPEIAAGTPATLASDMWSVGTLTYVLLSGISPFLGESDTETIRNVMHANYSLDISELAPITDEAKDFISKLLVLDPRKRLTVDDALNHRWLAVPFLEEAKLASDCLREFKYRHKWLERRVFVQQTPSEQLISPVQGPDVHLASALQRTTHGLARSEPCNIYDYLRIKDPVTLPSDDASFPITQRSPMNATLTKDRNRLSVDEKLDGSTLSGGHQKAGTADEQMPPLRLVRGEHRAIEEEIANRILSDISEENSIASTDEVELGTRSAKEPKRPRQRKSRSRSSTPNAEGYSQETTPLISPALTIESVETTSHQQFFPDSAELLHHPGQLDPKVPVGAPLFLEELSRPHALVLQGQDSPQHSSRSLSPRSPRSLPGTKSPVVLSPGKEYSMEVIIATKMGVPQVAQPHFETAGEIPPKLVPSESEKQKAKPSVHEDEFNSLINQIEMMKERRRKEREEMEKYRPKNIYREDIEFERPKIDEDDFPWESNYQIGPETFLLATRGAAFNARVRDYRRELWGDGAPFVTEGILGFRNQDISVRERRRFTDLVREDADIARSVDNLDRDMRGSRSGAVRRIQSDISKLEPTPTRKDGTFGAIFKRRLKDVAFTEGATEAIFECEVIGNPRPNVVWFYHESAISDDGKYKMIIDGDVYRLRIDRVSLADLGEYSCTATNENGTDRTTARLLAGDTPGRTGRPEIELSSDTEVFITWEAPSMSSCLEGYTYKLEMRPAGENDHFSEWRLVSNEIDEEAVVVRHLSPLGVYQFRVTAKNAFGWGAPSLTSRIIRTHPKGSPKLQTDILKQQYHLCVLSKPAKLQHPAQSLGGIAEEDEDETPSEVIQTKILAFSVNETEDPEKRFQLGSELWRGRFSLILNSNDTRAEIGQKCAAKIMQYSSEDQQSLREFEALKECQHENVLHLIAAYRKGDIMYLFTEKLHEDIFERFTYNDYYNEEQISRSVAQIAAALHWIHFKGIAHLDVRPSNIMFVSRRSWQLKLIDFGSAQTISPEAKVPSPLNAHWAAPELYQTEQPITVQSDVWGLGIIAFCLLSGFHPFSSEGDTDIEIKESVLHEKCNPNLIFVQASQESLRFVTWALKKNPLRRMRTGEALTHRWLSNDSSMVRRRETIKYPSSRLQKTVLFTAAPTNTTLSPALAAIVPK